MPTKASMSGSWLFPNGVDRERMLDMDRRVRPVRKAAFGVLGLALIASGPWIGWWTVVPLALAAIVFRVAEQRIDGAAKPEIGLFCAWALSQVIIAISVALTGGPSVATMSWFAIPLVTLSARFSERGVALGVGITLALMTGVAFGVDAAAVIANPPVLIAPASMAIAVAMLQTALMRSDIDARANAVIDPLTGMLNRQALAPRIAELQQQSVVTREPVGLIVCDLDHFKRINDDHGHAAGDAVLKDVAYRLRKSLRAFDLVYRIGGEEFLVLLPGADYDQAARVAEQLRLGLDGELSGAGHAVTMSFGVAASEPHEVFDYDALFVEADTALYAAKSDGRNCVRGADERVAAAALSGA
jgi:diguanylate cyclase (GGDEF)-like protein